MFSRSKADARNLWRSMWRKVKSLLRLVQSPLVRRRPSPGAVKLAELSLTSDEKRFRAGAVPERGHLGVRRAGLETFRRVEHARQQVDIAGGVEEDATPAEHPPDRKVDVRLTFERLVPGRVRVFAAQPRLRGD